ncbi:MAG TPA: gamma-glutamyltransferase family protein [Casimicrobiaceae bacterium]|jgi:gamma-glutamyltranspeptidase/glutathione hydrolase
MQPHRPVVAGATHVVSAGHYLAAQAGFAILEAGGNAIDAGVAAGIVLGVVQTDRVNFAGVAPIILYLASERRVMTLDGLGHWPRAADVRVFIERHGGHMPPGILRTVIPAAPSAWITALERFGTMSFGDVAQAAIRFARDGFPMHWLMAEWIAADEEAYRRWPETAAVFLPEGKPPRVGAPFVQADLGRTLQYMADQEAAHASAGRAAGLRAAHDAFYRGDIAATIAAYHRAHEGWVTADDLAGYRVRFEPPVHTRVRDIDLHACGPWCQGPVLLETLNVLAGLDLRAAGHNSPAYVHALTEAIKLAYADRHAWFGDPRFVDVPIERLLAKDYADERRRAIDPQRAYPGMPPAGMAKTTSELQSSIAETEPEPDTSYVCVIDRHGNAFSATPSDASSATPVIPGTGLCPSSRGSQSWCDPAHPSVLAPGKRPRLTPSPALALREGKAYLAFGSPGNDVQPQAMLQAFLNVHVFDMDVQSAVEAPRFASFSFPQSSEPHTYRPGRLNVESRVAGSTRDALAALGHDVVTWPERDWHAGAVCMVRVDPRTGVLEGAADPRTPSAALGW